MPQRSSPVWSNHSCVLGGARARGHRVTHALDWRISVPLDRGQIYRSIASEVLLAM